jgi:hypothetical protein
MTTTNFRMRTVTVITAVTALSWALPALAVATLEGRTITGDRVDAYDANAVMIYDPNADLTWLRDWNVNDDQAWVDQLIWVSNLQVGNFANWSLPTSRNQDGSGPCDGFNCIGSQMGYLWYEVLGNTANSFTNAGPFQNVQSRGYWSGTEFALNPNVAWTFGTGTGNQRAAGKGSALYPVAVRPGDVAAPIPEPQTWAMLLMGLGVVTVALRRRPG